MGLFADFITIASFTYEIPKFFGELLHDNLVDKARWLQNVAWVIMILIPLSFSIFVTYKNKERISKDACAKEQAVGHISIFLAHALQVISLTALTIGNKSIANSMVIYFFTGLTGTAIVTDYRKFKTLLIDDVETIVWCSAYMIGCIFLFKGWS